MRISIGLGINRASSGIPMGPELIPNGGFGSATGFTLGTGWVISGGVATFTANGTSQPLYAINLAATTAGRNYRLQFDIISNTLNAGGLRVGGFTGSSYFTATTTLSSTVGAKSFDLVSSPPAAGTTLDLWVNSTAATGAITIDNLSFRELL